jgi:chromosome segregation ATPase
MPTAANIPGLFTCYLPRTLLALVMILSVSLVEAGAQSKKKKRHRTTKAVAAKPVITNPTIAPPDSAANGDVKVISTADQDPAEVDKSGSLQKKSKSSTRVNGDEDDMKQTITTLSNQVNKLNDKLTQMQEDDRERLDMERLTRAEQRAEQLRQQLIDVQSKLADLQSRMEQIDYSLKPENIDRATQSYGAVHPEEAREARRKQLESEKKRLQDQIDILTTSKTRLEQSLASADNEVDLLRARRQQKELDDAIPKTDARPSNPRKPEP